MNHISRAPLYGRLLAVPANIRLGLKGLPATNALAYYEKVELTAVKCFIILATCGQISNLHLNVLNFSTPVLFRYLWRLKTVFCIGVCFMLFYSIWHLLKLNVVGIFSHRNQQSRGHIFSCVQPFYERA